VRKILHEKIYNLKLDVEAPAKEIGMLGSVKRSIGCRRWGRIRPGRRMTCWLALGLVAGMGWAGALRAQQRIWVRVAGSVVDDATGELVELFGVQKAQFLPDKSDAPRWTGASGPGTQGKGQFAFRDFVPAGQKIWARIIADGYEPTAITPEPIIAPAEAGRLVVRLRRGTAVAGVVLDHLGRPVQGATVYLAGRTPLNLENHRPYRPFYDTKSLTDPNGRFSLNGVTFVEEHLIIVSDSIQVWKSPLPMPGEQAVVRLPEPARFELGYATTEGGPDATFQLQYVSLGPQQPPPIGMLARVECTETFQLKSGALHTTELSPGAYMLTRTKSVKISNILRTRGADPLPFGVDAGKTFRTKLDRSHGSPITGRILGLESAGIERAFITITTGDANFDPRMPMKSRVFDFLASGSGGSFTTETLSPGNYTVVIEAYLPGQNIGSMILAAGNQAAASSPIGDVGPGGWPIPALVGSAKVTVPKAGAAPEVLIEVQPTRK
jgi:hypothetical protein